MRILSTGTEYIALDAGSNKVFKMSWPTAQEIAGSYGIEITENFEKFNEDIKCFGYHLVKEDEWTTTIKRINEKYCGRDV